jgi:hypothetical protein
MDDEKQQYLYEDLYGDIKHMLNLKKRNLGINNVNLNKSDSDDETRTSDSNYSNGKINLDDFFAQRLVQYLEVEIDKSFPNHSKLKGSLVNELRKVMKTGNDKEILKIAEKVRDIIVKEKIRFFDNIAKRVVKVLINKY